RAGAGDRQMMAASPALGRVGFIAQQGAALQAQRKAEGKALEMADLIASHPLRRPRPGLGDPAVWDAVPNDGASDANADERRDADPKARLVGPCIGVKVALEIGPSCAETGDRRSALSFPVLDKLPRRLSKVIERAEGQ